MKKLILALLMLAPGALWAERFSIKDGGDFAPVGQRVEFYDRYGWRSYKISFDFGLDEGNRSLTRDSRLSVQIVKRDGKRWDYTCKAKGSRALTSNINFLYGKGISVVVDCRIDQRAFAKAVDLDAEDVGAPGLVFHAMIQDGKATPGAQRGFYILPAGQLDASELNAYAGGGDDPTGLAVVLRSAEL